jgi:predicted small integral membrane protein
MSQGIIFVYGIFSLIFVVGGIGFSLREMRLNNFRTSDYFFLASALVGFLLANYLWFYQNQEFGGIFVGIWVPSNLALGLYFRTISSK